MWSAFEPSRWSQKRQQQQHWKIISHRERCFLVLSPVRDQEKFWVANEESTPKPQFCISEVRVLRRVRYSCLLSKNVKDFKASLLQNTMLWTFPHQLSRSSSLYNCSLSFELTLSAVISLCRVFPISRKVGLASGSCCQHCHMMAYLQQREHLLSKY